MVGPTAGGMACCENAAVDERWCLVHATHTDTSELDRITAAGAVVGLCPLTEAVWGMASFRLPHSQSDGPLRHRHGLEHSDRRGRGAAHAGVLATSGPAGTQRAGLGAGKSTGRTLFDTALAGGARVLRAPGGSQQGASLDVVSLDRPTPALVERRGDDILDSWIFCGGRGVVDCVWRAGEKVVINGRHRAPRCDRCALPARPEDRYCRRSPCYTLSPFQGRGVCMKKILGVVLAVIGAFAVGGIALHRDEPINALWIVVAAVCVYAARLPLLRRLDRGEGAVGGSHARDARGAPQQRPRLRADPPLGRLRPPFRRHRRSRPAGRPDARRAVRLPARHALDPGRRGARRLRAGHDHPVPVHAPRRPQPRPDGARRARAPSAASPRSSAR